jgi:hypothetical protein
MEAKVMEITLALVLVLVSNFRDGVQELEKQQYGTATAQFTKVIEAEPNITDIRELSYLYRAEAYLGSEEKDKALADLTVLIKTSESKERRDQAIAVYQKNGGDLKAFRPKDDPKAVMAKVLVALQAVDEKEVRAHLSGGLLRLLNTVDPVFNQQGGGRSFIGQVGREFRNAEFVSESINDTNQMAQITANLSGSKFTFGLEQKGGKWVFSDLLSFMPERRHRLHGHGAQGGSTANQDMNKLRQLDSAMEQSTMANRRSPARLADAAEYVRDFAGTSISSVDGKPFVFAIPKTGEKPWVFTAVATGGQRIGVINGSVQTMSEAAFVALAKAHGIRLHKDWKHVEVTDEEAAGIQKLIEALGAGTSKERKAAFKELIAVGEKTGTLLEEASHSPDPEIALQARKLLDAL